MTNEHENHSTDDSGDGERQERDPAGLHPRIWVGSLADYNAGRLHGAWIDADQPPEVITAAVRAMLNESTEPGAEEWGIFDTDDFGGFRIDEQEDFATIAAVAHGIRIHGPPFAAWAELHDAEPGMLAAFSDAYLGAYDSRDEWAETIADDLDIHQRLAALLPEDLQPYVRFDAAAYAHDAWLSGEICVIERGDGGAGVWIYRTT